MHRIAVVTIVLAAACAWGVRAQAPDSNFDKWWTPENEALTAASQHHTLLFENDDVRVFDGDDSARRQGAVSCPPIPERHLRRAAVALD